MSYIGTNKVGKMYLGSTAISKAYLGDDLVYDSAGGGQVLPYDAEIEYLQSSGTQYIDTGITISNNFKSELKGQYLQNNDNYRPLLGAYDSNGTKYGNVFSLQAGASGKLYVQIGGSYSYILSSASTLSMHTFITTLKNGVLTFSVDGTSNQKNFSGDYPSFSLVLFGQNRGTAIYGDVNAKIYYCKIWNGGNLVFDAIPVRVGSTGYMYDRVSGQLLGNNGSGSFTLGNDKS